MSQLIIVEPNKPDATSNTPDKISDGLLIMPANVRVTISGSDKNRTLQSITHYGSNACHSLQRCNERKDWLESLDNNHNGTSHTRNDNEHGSENNESGSMSDISSSGNKSNKHRTENNKTGEIDNCKIPTTAHEISCVIYYCITPLPRENHKHSVLNHQTVQIPTLAKMTVTFPADKTPAPPPKRRERHDKDNQLNHDHNKKNLWTQTPNRRGFHVTFAR
jgi:hypothetical protein